MTLLKISRMGHPVLRRRAEEITDPTSPEIATLARDMLETMIDASGVGLAAPQVHIGRRLIVFQVPSWRLGDRADDSAVPQTALVNPTFEPLSDQLVDGLEGCLSIPEIRGLVPRFEHIRYRGYTPEGMLVEREAEGFHARVVQHEIDHLDGVLFLDRMTDFQSLAFESEMHHLMGVDEDDDEEPIEAA